MPNKIYALVLGCLVAACSGSEGAYSEELLDSGEQDFSAKNSTTFQYGTRTASSALACTKNSTGQVCSVPSLGSAGVRQVDWSFTPLSGLTTEEKQGVRNAITALDNTLTGWTFAESSSAGDIQFARAVVSGSSSSNNIDAFRGVTLQTLNDLSEGAGVVGQYKEHAGCLVTLDIADIIARGSSAAEIGKLRTHAILSGAMACIGLGTRDDAGSVGHYIDRTVLVPGPIFRPLATAGDLCRANSYTPTPNGQFSIIAGNCAD